MLRRFNRERGTAILVVAQNARVALSNADDGYVMELGRIVAHGTCQALMQKDDVKEFYLGVHGAGGQRRVRWKRRKTWR